MNTPNSQANTVVTAPWSKLQTCTTAATSKLVVVVSDVSEEAALAGRILRQARDNNQLILLFGVAATPEDEAELHLNLITVEGFVAAEGHPVDLQVQSGIGWLQKVKAEIGPTDQVTCYAEAGLGVWSQPLSDVLAHALQVPIQDFSALHNPPGSGQRILPQVVAWLGSIATIGGFLALQAKIVLEMQGAAQNGALLLTLLPEVALIWFWNSLLG